MKENEVILKRQKQSTYFKNEDMDFMFNWAVGVSQIIGMSPSQIFHAIKNVNNGNAADWRKGFRDQGDYQVGRAKKYVEGKYHLAAGQFFIGAAYAYRAALQYTDPLANDFHERVKEMQESFQKGLDLIGVPMKYVEIPFDGGELTGYYLENDNKCPTVVMVGGGDTFAEDLFYFAGYPGWKRNYNVLMIDLPGQGMAPDNGFKFQANMHEPIKVVIDWLELNSTFKPEDIAIYGISGGGFFTAQAVANDSRIKAWIAATPITDIAKIFEREFGSTLKAPGWLLNTFMKIGGFLNESAEINLNKYAWQFGTNDFKSAVDRVFEEAKPVDHSAITCPSLFLLSEGEGAELKRQTLELYENLKKRGIDVNLHEFTAEEGADGHCQINNLRLLHLVAFDWLDRIFEKRTVDVRMIC